MPKCEPTRNLLGDLFEAAYLEHQRAQGITNPVPYFRQKHDYIQLARLLSVASEANWQITPERFLVALNHYFQSELPGYPSLGHLAARFSNYYRNPCNRFGQPLHVSSGRNGKAIDMMERRYGKGRAADSVRVDHSEVPDRKRLTDGGR